MKQRAIWKIFLISSTTTLFCILFFAIYYNVIVPDHTGPMDLWAIIILLLSFIPLVVSIIMIYINKYDMDECFEGNTLYQKYKTFFSKIFTIIAYIILFPFILLFLIVGLIIGNHRREFKKLKKIGFKYKYKKPKHIFIRDNIIIEIFHTYEDYYISFDNGQTFERVEDTNLGLPYNRDNLKFKLNKYKYTSGLERQRGEAFPQLPDFIDFLVSVLKQNGENYEK